MAVLFTAPFVTALNLSGLPISGATLTFYTTGTSTLAAVYANSALTVALTNPVVTDAAGRFPAIYLATATAYRAVLRDAGGAVIRDTDPVSGSLASSVTVSLFDFIDPSLYSAIRARTYAGDLSTQIQAAITGASGGTLYIPAGKYPYASAPTVGKALRTRIVGENATLDAPPGGTINGAELAFTGTSGPGMTVGVADGNPDTTGYCTGFSAEYVNFSTPFGTGGDNAILIQNSAGWAVRRCKFYGYKGKVVYLYGGNVTGKVDDCHVLGTGAAGTGNDGIYFGSYQFGNFDITIERNHILQLERGVVFGPGRYVVCHNNTVEVLTVAQWGFAGTGDISDLSIWLNKSETQRGYAFDKTGFTGQIVRLSHKGNVYFGSGNASFVNPGFGNLDRGKVLASDTPDGSNFILVTANNGSLASPAVFPNSSMWDAATTSCLGDIQGSGWENDLFASIRGKELIGGSGAFASLDGGAVAGTYPNIATGGKPQGWTNLLSAGTWALLTEAIVGGPVCTVAAGAATDACSIVLTLTPVNRVRYFAVGVTARGWLQVYADGTQILDVGSSLARYVVPIVRFSVAANAASTTIKLAKPTGQSLTIAEVSAYEVGPADYNNTSATAAAVSRLMKRGIYT